jgi:hypothetical protein
MARTQQNKLVGAIESNADATPAAFASFVQQWQMAEDFECRQRRLEREEERARREEERSHHEEELHEMWRKESRQQEQMSMAFQLALTGLMTYLGTKRDPDDKDPSSKK